LKRLIVLLACMTSTAWADFGEYEGYEFDGNTLTISSTEGRLRIAAVDDAAFEVHYVGKGVKQLPSFALAPQDREFSTAIAETDGTLTIMIDGITAVVDKSAGHGSTWTPPAAL
jgi:hypothetical protein